MPVGGEPLGEVAVPALGAADGVREQAVVDEADAHAAARSVTAGCRGYASRRGSRATSRVDVALTQRDAHAPSRRMSTVEQTQPAAPGAPSRRSVLRLGRDPVPERGGEHRGVRRAALAACWRAPGIAGEVVVADNGSEDGSAELAARRRRARRPRAAPRLRQRLPGRLRRRPRRATSSWPTPT